MNEFTDENFESSVEKSDGVVVVDFWAAWCRPCIMLKPLFLKIATAVPDATFGTLNIEENTRMTAKYSISALPSILVFKDGKEVQRITGLPNEDKFIKAVREQI